MIVDVADVENVVSVDNVIVEKKDEKIEVKKKNDALEKIRIIEESLILL